MRLVVAGLGKLGVPLAAALAAAGHEVVGVDPYAEETVRDIAHGRFARFDEPGLPELLLGLPRFAFQATTLYRHAMPKADASLIVVPTPSGSDGRFDASNVVDAVKSIAALTPPDHLIVVCSTVQPGTMERLVAPAAAGRPVAYAPMLIALGSVIHDLRHPDLSIIGAEHAEVRDRVEEIIGPMVANRAAPVAMMSLIDAEVTKLAINAYLAMKIAYVLTIMEGCEGTPGADAAAVLGAVGLDSRIGSKFLKPGGPTSGPCIPRDGDALGAWLGEAETTYEARFFPAAAQDVNQAATRRIIEMLKGYGLVAILGLSYKTGTGVTERSLGIAVADALANFITHDPSGGGEYGYTAQQVVDECDAVLVATPHPEYADLKYGGKPVIDVWGLLPPAPGVWRLGRWRLA